MRENGVAGAAHDTPSPALQGPLDSWLSASSAQAEVHKAAKPLALAETPIKIALQVQDHTHSIAYPPVCSLACPCTRPLASAPARWHARLPNCPLALGGGWLSTPSVCVSTTQIDPQTQASIMSIVDQQVGRCQAGSSYLKLFTPQQSAVLSPSLASWYIPRVRHISEGLLRGF